jgi:hypothetical protein
MGNNQNALREVIFNFQKHPEYRQIHASGFWCSVMPTGELFFNIYEEIPRTPDKTKLVVISPTETREEPIDEQQDTYLMIDRILHVGVTISMETLPSIIKWLQDKYNEYQTLKNANMPQKEKS